MYPVRKKGTVLKAASMPEKELNSWLATHLNNEIAEVKVTGRLFSRVLVLYYEEVSYCPEGSRYGQAV